MPLLLLFLLPPLLPVMGILVRVGIRICADTATATALSYKLLLQHSDVAHDLF